MPNTHTELVAQLNAISNAQPFTVSWYFKNLKTGEEADRAGDVVTPSASSRKIAYLMAALREVHAGRMDLAEKVTVTAELQEGAVSGVLYFMTPGLTFPLRDALMQMIITSDNTCTTLVGERITLPVLNEFIQSVGMKGTLVRHIVPPRDMPHDADFDFVGQTTPNDQGRLLQMILDGSTDTAAATRLGVTPELCRLALQILCWQRLRNSIPALLPTNTQVANKTGTGKNGLMDAGIVYRDGKADFIITTSTHHVPWTLADGMPGHQAAAHAMARLARACWDHMSANQPAQKASP